MGTQPEIKMSALLYFSLFSALLCLWREINRSRIEELNFRQLRVGELSPTHFLQLDFSMNSKKPSLCQKKKVKFYNILW